MGEQQDGEEKTRKEIQAKRSKGTSFNLDLISEVLLRLPAKSVVKFRCVSKLCSSITTLPCFSRSFAARSSQSPCLVILLEDKHDKLFVFSLTQQQQHQNSNNPVAVVVDSYSMQCPKRYSFLSVESVHGLICVVKSGNPQIWNPTTRRFSTLPKTWRDGTVSSIGYDPIDGTYKVLSMPCDGPRPRQPRALTLIGEAGWRVIEGIPKHAPFRCEAPCINGVLYYLAAPNILDQYTNQFLVSFHVRSEKFSIIKVPWNLARGLRFLVHCEGNLVSVISKDDDIVMWTLEDAEKQEWSYKHLRLPFPRSDPISQTREAASEESWFMGLRMINLGAGMDLETNLSISYLLLPIT